MAVVTEPTIDPAALYAALDGAREGTWRDLAAELDIPPSTFSRLKEGEVPASFGRVMQLVGWLDADVSEFLACEGCPDDAPQLDEQEQAPDVAAEPEAAADDPEAPDGDGEPAGGVPVEGPVVFEGVWTGDVRRFPLGAFTWADTVPVPIILDLTDGDHTGRTVGAIHDFARQTDGDTAAIVADGNLSDSSDPETAAAVARATELIEEGAVGVSIKWDLDPATFDGIDMDDVEAMDPDEFESLVSEASLRIRHVAIVDTPAFADARLRITGTLAAAATVPALPAKHFERWESPKPQPLTVDLDGRVWGIVAPSGTCHRSDSFKACAMYPGEADPSLSQFHTKQAWFDDGRLARVGTLTFEGMHALRTGDRRSLEQIQRHREDSTSVFAIVQAWPTRHGLAVAGTVVDGLSKRQVMQAIGCGVSVEMWRNRTCGIHLAPTEAWAVAASAAEGLEAGELVTFTTGATLTAAETGPPPAATPPADSVVEALSRIERALAVLAADRMLDGIPDPDLVDRQTPTV